MNQINLPFDPIVITWIITAGGLSGIFVLIWRVAVKIEHRITELYGRITAIEDNTLLTAWREVEISKAKNLFDPDAKLKSWEDSIKKRLQEQGDNTK
ncbi:MAG: hypothetical protein M3P08_17280 [Thermoproteota archaeon]|nr:hypothetical protein [Thermoproteota archaeon]